MHIKRFRMLFYFGCEEWINSYRYNYCKDQTCNYCKDQVCFGRLIGMQLKSVVCITHLSAPDVTGSIWNSRNDRRNEQCRCGPLNLQFPSSTNTGFKHYWVEGVGAYKTMFCSGFFF